MKIVLASTKIFEEIEISKISSIPKDRWISMIDQAFFMKLEGLNGKESTHIEFMSDDSYQVIKQELLQNKDLWKFSGELGLIFLDLVDPSDELVAHILKNYFNWSRDAWILVYRFSNYIERLPMLFFKMYPFENKGYKELALEYLPGEFWSKYKAAYYLLN